MKSQSSGLRIARVSAMADYQRCVEIEKRVWGYTDSADVVPRSLLSIMNQCGGLLLAAYTRVGAVIGFLFGFPALKQGRLVHHSHMLAVLPEYRNRGIGWRLKQGQRRWAQRRGIDLITWTFDPLQALNAHFGIAKLGATVGEYKVNVYGESTSPLHRGLATDRFLAEWFTGRPPAKRAGVQMPRRMDARKLSPLINETRLEPSGFRSSLEPRLNRKESYLWFEIPIDIEAIKSADLALAIDWQKKVRHTFQTYFRRRYYVIGFRIMGRGDEARGFYELAGPREKPMIKES